jgi:carbamoyl-phosphate synthase/aspartate carbamoyltransferase/dihydroorotase
MATLKLPGLIDPHVHVRDLGQSHKEDWDSCTAAALAGGITTIFAMPNTQPPIVDGDALAQYTQAAQQKARCDYGIYVGSNDRNVNSGYLMAARCAGMKMYLDVTFGMLKMEGLDLLVQHAANWPKHKPLLAHAEEHQCASAIMAAHLAGRSIHICHVARKSEIELIAKAKNKGFDVTCEVCPHHLFLFVDEMRARGFADGFTEVRPRLQTRADAEALWQHLDIIDCFATDHASHTLSEKQSDNPPPGFPGLEQALALWLTAAHAGRLTRDDIVSRMHTNPARIFGVPTHAETLVEVDVDYPWIVRAADQFTKAGWTPYDGMSLRGKVTKTVLHGTLAYDGERVLAQPGTGQATNGQRLGI